MKKYLLILVLPLIMGLGCNSFVLDKKVPPVEDLKSNNEQPVDEDIDIILDSPQADQAISSPLIITGRARGNWYFEASFPIVLTDWDGRIIAEYYATAQGDWMTEDFVPFKSTLVFDTPVYKDSPDFMRNGFLILQKDNPSGLPEYDDALEIGIKFADINTNNLSLPIEDFESRITKKPFGLYITPQTSPVQPEKFTGYHTGVDVEYGDEQNDVPVKAITEGEVVRSGWVSGYGGMTAIRHNIDNRDYIVVYGHLSPDNLLAEGNQVLRGETIGILGEAYSHQTDGERKHLHLAVYTGTDINVKGYVINQTELSKWIDPVEFLK